VKVLAGASLSYLRIASAAEDQVTRRLHSVLRSAWAGRSRLPFSDDHRPPPSPFVRCFPGTTVTVTGAFGAAAAPAARRLRPLTLLGAAFAAVFVAVCMMAAVSVSSCRRARRRSARMAAGCGLSAHGGSRGGSARSIHPPTCAVDDGVAAPPSGSQPALATLSALATLGWRGAARVQSLAGVAAPPSGSQPALATLATLSALATFGWRGAAKVQSLAGVDVIASVRSEDGPGRVLPPMIWPSR